MLVTFMMLFSAGRETEQKESTHLVNEEGGHTLAQPPGLPSPKQLL